MALAAATGFIEGKLTKPLKKLLKKISEDVQEPLLVADAKLGNSIKVAFLIIIIKIIFSIENEMNF
jgi:hypothetical protein